MNDPHVESIRYRLVVDQRFGRFEDPVPLDLETNAYRMHLENDVLTVDMKEHHASAESAIQKVEPALKAWELSAALTRDHTWIKFDFDHNGTRIVDRNPTPLKPGEARAYPSSAVAKAVALSATATGSSLILREYPAPPKAFEDSPEVEVVFARYQRAVWDDPSQLLSIGYLFLTVLEVLQGSRVKASKKYKVELKVLNTLGTITSTKGNLGEARKYKGGAKQAALTQQQRLWVRAAIKALLRRVAGFDHDPSAVSSPPKITMSVLPKL